MGALYLRSAIFRVLYSLQLEESSRKNSAVKEKSRKRKTCMFRDNLFNELIRANCADMAYKKPLRTVAELERAISGA